jgi:hypothetical protein
VLSVPPRWPRYVAHISSLQALLVDLPADMFALGGDAGLFPSPPSPRPPPSPRE